MIEIKAHRVVRDGRSVSWVPTKNKGGVIKPLYIVCHDTASGLKDDGDINWLANQSPNSSAHFVISREGKITQLAPTNIKTWHAGKSKWAGINLLNGHSIGIEIDNPGKMNRIREGVYSGVTTIDATKDKSLVVGQATTAAHGSGWWLAYSDAQLETVTGLCRAIVTAYPSIKDIVTHWMISPGRKIDTNPLFPLEALRSRVLGGADKPAPVAPPKAPILPDATVTASALNLRGNPRDGKVLASLPRGTRIDVQEVAEPGWLRIIVADGKSKGKTGFVSASWVALD